MIGIFPLIALALAAPAAAAAPAVSDEAAILAQIRGFADPTAGLMVKNGAADKVVFLSRAADGGVIAIGIAALAPGAVLEDVPAGTRAILRTRARSPKGNAAPDPADGALAVKAGIPVFVVGEWRKPPVVWEVVARAGGTEFREIDAKGAARAWRALQP